MRHKPTAEEKRLIRECAVRSARKRRVRLEPGERVDVTGADRGADMNVALISDRDDLEGTDLHEFRSWADFCSGFDFAPGGRAIVDFYVSSVGDRGELETNVTAHWRDGKLVKITGTGDGVMWPR